MDLQDFVTKTIVSLQTGIEDVNDQLKPAHAFILGSSGKNKDGESWKARVEFDVAIEVEESSSKKADAGVRIKVVSGGIGKETESKEKNASRIRFFVEQRQR